MCVSTAAFGGLEPDSPAGEGMKFGSHSCQGLLILSRGPALNPWHWYSWKPEVFDELGCLDTKEMDENCSTCRVPGPFLCTVAGEGGSPLPAFEGLFLRNICDRMWKQILGCPLVCPMSSDYPRQWDSLREIHSIFPGR